MRGAGRIEATPGIGKLIFGKIFTFTGIPKQEAG